MAENYNFTLISGSIIIGGDVVVGGGGVSIGLRAAHAGIGSGRVATVLLVGG